MSFSFSPRLVVFGALGLLCLVCRLAALPAAAQAPADQPPTSATEVLIWNNGDRLAGNWQAADATELTWQAPQLFRDPLRIDWRSLSEIRFAGEPRKVEQGFLVRTVDRSALTGEIVRLDERHLVLRSPRFGEQAIDRSQIFSIGNLAHSRSQLMGEFDLEQWESDRGQKKDWNVNGLGQLHTNRANTQIFRRLEFPENILIELELQWASKLDFVVAFGVPQNRTRLDDVPRIETWDDSLVLSHKDSFEIISESIDKQSQRLRLLIQWDRAQKQMTVFDERGSLLTQAQVGDLPAQTELGILLANKGPSLTVHELTTRQSAVGFDATRTSVQTVAGVSVNDRLASFDGTVWRTTGDQAAPLEIPAAEFLGAFLLNPLNERAAQACVVDYWDGMVLAGNLLQMRDQQLVLQTLFASEPLTLRCEQIRGIRWSDSKEDAATQANVQAEQARFPHVLTTSEGAVRGQLESGTGAADDILRWRMVGARDAVPFTQGNSSVKIQDLPAETQVADTQFRDTLYLHNRDIIPANVREIRDNRVYIDSFIEHQSISTHLIRGIDLETNTGSRPVPLDDPNWQFPANNPKSLVKGGRLSIHGGISISHLSLLETGACSFTWHVSRDSYSSLSLNLLTKGNNTPHANINVSLAAYNGEIHVSDSGTRNTQSSRRVKDQPRIQIYFDDGQLIVSVDEHVILKRNAIIGPEAGRGVNFRSEGSVATLSDFSQDRSGRRRHAFLDQQRKELLLTIPRLKKKSPPQNIVCAVNSDLVRGDVVQLDQQKLVLRTNEEMKPIPREFVSTVIWPDMSQLPESDETAANPAAEATPPGTVATTSGQTVQVLLNNGRQLTITLASWQDGLLRGHSEILGNCQIPWSEIYELRMGTYATAAADVRYSDWVAKLAPAPPTETESADSGRAFGQDSSWIGKPAAGFQVPGLEGTEVALKDYRGRVLVLDFWATWCGPCVAELPKLAKVIKEFPDDHVALLALNQEEEAEAVAEFVHKRQWNFPIALDNGQVAKDYGVTAFPTTVIIDRDGRIAFYNVGAQPDFEQKLKQALQSLLEPATESAPVSDQ